MGAQLEVMDALYKAGTALKLKYMNGMTSLHWAGYEGQLDSISMPLNRRANI